MGEYAEMMLDGTCCCSCGEFLGDGDGYAVYCASCQPSEPKKTKPIKPAKYRPPKVVGCLNSDCRRKFIDENAMKMHMWTFHIDKDAMREKQEKDKKLNNIRNAATALLEALEELMSCSAMYEDEHVTVYATTKQIYKARDAIKLSRGE